MFPAKFANTCWSLIETDDSIKVGAQYAPGDGKIASTQAFISQMNEEDALRKAGDSCGARIDVRASNMPVGLGALEQALQNLQGTVQAELHFQPFGLNPQMAAEGQDASEHLTQK